MTTRELRDLDNSELGLQDRNKSRSRSRSPPAQNAQRKSENLSSVARSRFKNLSSQKRLTSQQMMSRPKVSVASAFNQDSDDEPEVMPPEAKMRMKNMGRDTPTSSGPNSFGKTKQGFSDAKKLFEKSLKDAMESALKDD